MVIMMSESIVARYLKYATTVMVKNNDTGIKCPCRTCKLGTVLDPFSGTLQEHLLRKGFMDDFTYEDDDEDVRGGAAGNDQEDGEAPPDYGDEEYVGHDDEEEVDINGGEDAGTPTLLTSVVRDPHVQELLLKKSSTAAREAKLAQPMSVFRKTLFQGDTGSIAS